MLACCCYYDRISNQTLANLQFIHIFFCDQYMDTAINQMSEAWEDILLEMDSKLKTLAEDKYVSMFIGC